MSERIPYNPATRVNRADGAGDSGWIELLGVDVATQLHVLAGSGTFETTGSALADVRADNAVANPVTDAPVDAPWSDGLYPSPVAVRFVGTGTWAIQQAARGVA